MARRPTNKWTNTLLPSPVWGRLTTSIVFKTVNFASASPSVNSAVSVCSPALSVSRQADFKSITTLPGDALYCSFDTGLPSTLIPVNFPYVSLSYSEFVCSQPCEVCRTDSRNAREPSFENPEHRASVFRHLQCPAWTIDLSPGVAGPVLTIQQPPWNFIISRGALFMGFLATLAGSPAEQSLRRQLHFPVSYPIAASTLSSVRAVASVNSALTCGCSPRAMQRPICAISRL